MQVYRTPTIARNNDELIVAGNFMSDYVRKSGDNLLFGREVCTLLELKVPQGTGKRKVAVHTAKVDKSASCTYSGFLAWFFLARMPQDPGCDSIPSFCGL